MLALTYSIAWLLPQVGIAKIDPETAVGVWLLDEGGRQRNERCVWKRS